MEISVGAMQKKNESMNIMTNDSLAKGQTSMNQTINTDVTVKEVKNMDNHYMADSYQKGESYKEKA